MKLFKSKIFNILKLFIGIGIILYLLYKIDIYEVKNVIFNAKLGYILIAFSLLFMFHLLSAINLKYLMDPLSKIKLRVWLTYYLFSYGLSLFTPGQIGEMTIPYFLKKEGVKLGRGTAIFILNKLISFSILIVFAFYGIMILFSVTFSLILYPLAVLVFLIITSIVLFSKKGRNFIQKHILKSYAQKFEGFSEALNYLFKNKKSRFIISTLLVILKWLIYGIMFMNLFLAFNTYVSPIKIIFIAAIAAIVALIPLTPQGLGLRESIAVLLFSQLGIAVAIVAAAYLINLFLCYLLGGASIIGYILPIKHTKNLKVKQKL